MADVKVYFSQEIIVPKKNGKSRRYKADTKYTIDYDLFLIIAEYCDVLKMKDDPESEDMVSEVVSKKEQKENDIVHGIKRQYQYTWD